MSPEEAADIYRRALAAEVAARLGEVIGGVEDTARQLEQATGQRIVARRPQVLDARRGELDRMSRQAREWLAAMEVVDRWLLPRGDQRSLGAVIKVMPADEARLLRVHLAAAGVLPADEVAP